MINRRREQRIRTLEFGKIVGRQMTTIDCLVRNISAGGACLQVEDGEQIPQEFVLKIPIENLRRACRIAWKSQDRVGVAFLGAGIQVSRSPNASV